MRSRSRRSSRRPRHVRARGGGLRASSPTRRRSPALARPAGLPDLRRAAERAATTHADREAMAAAGIPEPLARSLLLDEPGRDEDFVDAIPADHRGRSWRRASRTRPSTATTAWSRSTRSAATRVAWSPAADPRGQRRARPPASRASCSSRRPTTPNAAATCGRGSARSRPMAGEWRDGCCAGARSPSCSARGSSRRQRGVLLYQTLVGAWPLEARSGSPPTS